MFRSFLRRTEVILEPRWMPLAMLILVACVITEIGIREGAMRDEVWKTVHNATFVLFSGWWAVLLIHYAVSYCDWLHDSVDRFKNKKRAQE